MLANTFIVTRASESFGSSALGTATNSIMDSINTTIIISGRVRVGVSRNCCSGCCFSSYLIIAFIINIIAIAIIIVIKSNCAENVVPYLKKLTVV